MSKRVLCCYGIDLDAVAGWLTTTTGAPQDPTDLSRGVFGATIGTDRLLSLLSKYNIHATWFVPAHTAESFPSQIRKIVDAGHEIGLHGYTHEFVSDLSVEQQRDVLRKSIEVLRGFTGGEGVKGWTAPAWKTGREVVGLLEEFGVEYDHSFMHHDSQPYYLPDPAQTHTIEPNIQNAASSWMKPMSALKPSSIVEIPANWHLDDWPPFQLSLSQPSTHGYVDTHVIERLWKEQFEYLYRECPEGGGFVFPISIHPQVSGKPQVLLMHERLIEWINVHKGVEWVTFERVCGEFKEGGLEGVVVEGGV